mmetsp:Transcript_28657/g.39580  ORF Transcript_28657/g.39580 Transcript_28657/m.39580 type:complete len:256 (+) Transcript_28657:222-989(+)|eukprot:CAMPEP_0196594810 /NCGR_PEP_ID=MMETSP1081-20130531/79331_1 /TAXON_ID=36882 /ORGANISM="Pyramimonas amylifera, Strain CCMP720" /LENGTH=255 /DNA_ID=CAMNT_0041919167 /DNA_START=220 /DNA_END=987 /DNA_ORIENTATION=-
MEDKECHERVVLVSVRGGTKPRRKVAIALPPENDYTVFADRVRKKLNLSGVGGIFHAETNLPVTDLSELQDIDDLVVEEGAPPPQIFSQSNGGKAVETRLTNNVSSPGSNSLGRGTSSRKLRASSSSGLGNQADLENGSDEDNEKKYVRRGNPLLRFLVKVVPTGLLRSSSSTLPVTTKDTENGGGAWAATKRRQKNSPLDPRKVLLIFALASCMATMLLLYTRLSVGPALASSVMDDKRDHIFSSETLNMGTSH